MSGPKNYKDKFVRWINKNNIKVGDKVQIHDLYPISNKCILDRHNEGLLNWWGRHSDWIKKVIEFSRKYNKQIATIVEINYDNSRSNIILDITNEVPWPYYCLQKVEDNDITETTSTTKEISIMSKRTFKRNDLVLIRKDDVNSKWIRAVYVHMVDNDTKHICKLIYNEFTTNTNIEVEVDKDFIIPYTEDTSVLENTTREYHPLEFIKKNDLVLVSNELDNEYYTWEIGCLKSGYIDSNRECSIIVHGNNSESTRYYRYFIPYKGNEDKLGKVATVEDYKNV